MNRTIHRVAVIRGRLKVAMWIVMGEIYQSGKHRCEDIEFQN